MKREMECPFCDGTAELIIERKETEFREKESFVINHFFYRCNKCNEEFTTNEVDSFTLEQLHNQYREYTRL